MLWEKGKNKAIATTEEYILENSSDLILEIWLRKVKIANMYKNSYSANGIFHEQSI